MEAYCVKCKSKKEMKNAKAITMKNGKPATQGICPSCGTKVFRIGSCDQPITAKIATNVRSGKSLNNSSANYIRMPLDMTHLMSEWRRGVQV